MKRGMILTIIFTLSITALSTAADIRVSSNITTDTYWTADNTYILDALVYVESGASLFIEAGTVVKGAAGQEANAKALIVCRGAKIYAEGTAEKPIIFTAESDDPTDPYDVSYNEVGLWGGLVILGNARTNAPGGEANFEGIDPIPNTLYGGTDDDDCSGLLRYVSIRHGGTQIGAGKEINGLSSAGVGRGTVYSHVEVYSNKDDAFEWWGGCVRCDHLVAAFCQDDAIDLDEGNRSKMQYVFVIQDVNGDVSDTRIGEHDGCHKNNIGGEPTAHPVIYNATYLGAGVDGNAADYIFRMRENFGGEYKNSIFGDFNGKAVRIDSSTSPDSYDRLIAGDLVFNNNLWFDVAAGNSWTMDVVSNQYVIDYFGNAATMNEWKNPQLAGISHTSMSKGLDPRPATDGPAYDDLAALPETDDFFECAPYKGAFGPTNWMKGWTALDHYGFLADDKVPAQTVNVTANITTDTHWTADNTYVLQGMIYVESPATLFIEAGTVIKGAPGQEANSKALIVCRGAKIIADGTGVKPIIFTAESDDPTDPYDVSYNEVGLWGGLVILGNARTNAPGGEANFEGIDPIPNTLYGGTDDDDCSGLLRYVSIRHGGTQIGAGKEINGLSSAGVGRGTVYSHVEVYSNKDDAFEWWGGCVRCDHLVAAFCQDDAIDLDEGNRSKMQYVFVIQDVNGDVSDTRIGEHDGCHKNNIGGEPTAHPVIYNATYLGAGVDGNAADYIFRMRENFGGEYKNSIFGDFNGKAVRIDSSTSPDSYDRLIAGDLVFNNNLWFDVAAGNSWTMDVVSNQYVIDYFGNAATMNEWKNPDLASVDRSPSGIGLDPRPDFSGPAFDDLAEDAFETNLDVFECAPYKGAFGPTNWLEGWTALDAYGIISGGGSSIQGGRNFKTPSSFALSQNYPNPFNPTTTIEYSVASRSFVKLEVFNILGQNIAILAKGYRAAGVYKVQWNAENLNSGVYIVQLTIGNKKVLTNKMMLLK